MTVEELKHALINFNSIYKWWEENTAQYCGLVHELEGVKGIRYDKEIGGNGSTQNIDQKKLDLIEKKDKVVARNKYYEDTINEVHDFIEWLEEPFKQMVIDKHFNEYGKTKMAMKYAYSESHIYYLIDRMIEKYLKSLET